MNLLDKLVAQALTGREEMLPLRTAVEKELLHHDILREMSDAGLLKDLTFIGGTCLRAVYGSQRLSEDLDFSGGRDFDRKQLFDLGSLLVDRLQAKYGLPVEVTDPQKETGNVSTWKMKVIIRPQSRHLPAQKINLDICAVPSYERCPRLLRNHYGVEMGTTGLIIQAESLGEIMADKLLAFALRPNRIKNRDLWDLAWLKQQGVTPAPGLLLKKIADYQCHVDDFLKLYNHRLRAMSEDPAVQKEFNFEMQRFLPQGLIWKRIRDENFWPCLVQLMASELKSPAEESTL